MYNLSNAFIQLGFVVGPIGGGALMMAFGFWNMSIILGGLVFLYAAVFAWSFRGGIVAGATGEDVDEATRPLKKKQLDAAEGSVEGKPQAVSVHVAKETVPEGVVEVAV